MEQLHYLNNKAMTALMLQQLILQQELIEAQRQVIALQKRIDKMTPKNPKDKDIFWHMVSEGISSTQAAHSDDLLTLKQFYEWNVSFAKKHIKPYVNPKVYGECLNQMTRGLGDRIATLQTKEELRQRNNGHTPRMNITSIR